MRAVALAAVALAAMAVALEEPCRLEPCRLACLPLEYTCRPFPRTTSVAGAQYRGKNALMRPHLAALTAQTLITNGLLLVLRDFPHLLDSQGTAHLEKYVKMPAIECFLQNAQSLQNKTLTFVNRRTSLSTKSPLRKVEHSLQKGKPTLDT